MESNTDISTIAYDFSKRIVLTYKRLTQETLCKEYVLSKQLLRSGTSIGANVEEAQHPQSTADFISKMSIALKEARETQYWIRLLRDTDYLPKTEADSLLNDCQSILYILIAIVNTASKKKAKVK